MAELECAWTSGCPRAFLDRQAKGPPFVEGRSRVVYLFRIGVPSAVPLHSRP
jgi:hypothetical protein